MRRERRNRIFISKVIGFVYLTNIIKNENNPQSNKEKRKKSAAKSLKPDLHSSIAANGSLRAVQAAAAELRVIDDIFTQVVKMLVNQKIISLDVHRAEFATVAIAHNIKKMISVMDATPLARLLASSGVKRVGDFAG